MNSILVTGAAGFIGSHLVKKLLKQNYYVTGVDNFNDYYNPKWKKNNIKQLKTNKKFFSYKEDILNFTGVDNIIKRHKPSIIIHLAARAGVRPSIDDPFIYQKVNIEGTLNMLELTKKHSIKKFLFASSSSVYGNQKKIPFSENDPIRNPVSPYATTKIAGEMLVNTYSHLYDINSLCFRLFTAYGPSGRPDMSPYLFTERILNNKPINKFGDGNTSRDYTYVDDIVDGIISAINYDTKFEVFNLGNNTTITLNEFIKTLEKVTGTKSIIKHFPLQPGDVLNTYADIDKAKKFLKYKPKTTLYEGLLKFVKWYKENRLESV